MKSSVPICEVIAKLKPRKFLKLETIAPYGTLVLRKTGKGSVVFYWRVTIGSKSPAYQIGLYDSSAPPLSKLPTPNGYSLRAARMAAESMAEKHYAALSDGGYETVIAQQQQQEQALAKENAAAGHSLEKLYLLYADSLATRNHETAKQARNLFAKNVAAVFPEIACTQANKVSSEQIVTVLRDIWSAEKFNTARKLKAYLHAAYAMAKNADHNPTVAEEFKAFAIKQNPVSDIEGVKPKDTGVDKNALLPDDMRKYWQVISKAGEQTAFLRLHLLLGGQRLEQLVRLKNCDVHEDMLVLWDSKGRTGSVRPIVVPLIPAALAALKELQAQGEYALSVTPGRPLSSRTVNTWAQNVVGEQIPAFTLKRVRSGVTTLLSKLQVNAEIRNHLQSHNLHGVEARHYNMYDFADEKRKALEDMYAFLVTSSK